MESGGDQLLFLCRNWRVNVMYETVSVSGGDETLGILLPSMGRSSRMRAALKRTVKDSTLQWQVSPATFHLQENPNETCK